MKYIIYKREFIKGRRFATCGGAAVGGWRRSSAVMFIEFPGRIRCSAARACGQGERRLPANGDCCAREG